MKYTLTVLAAPFMMIAVILGFIFQALKIGGLLGVKIFNDFTFP